MNMLQFFSPDRKASLSCNHAIEVRLSADAPQRDQKKWRQPDAGWRHPLIGFP